MFFGILTMITALSISAVAIYYSVAGLVAIFAAAAIPIMIMGGTLEIAKLVTAVWLHRYWKEAVWWLKGYLSISVVILMFITSMGIFGFLSKAHIEQTATANEGLARLEQIETEIARQNTIVTRSEQAIATAENSNVNADAEIQAQIDREQERINNAYSRVQPSIDEQTAIIQKEETTLQPRIQPFQDQVSAIDSTLASLTSALSSNDIKAAQGIVGVKQDGDLGPGTSRAIQSFRDEQEATRANLLNRIEEIRTSPNPTIDAARAEITRLRGLAETEITDSNALIARLRTQLGTVKDTTAIDAEIAKETAAIKLANETINTLTEEKYKLEAEYRKLEAEVGPVKYLAEFVYGAAADTNLLEQAVRWVIVTIIFVFDPLAVLLLIASQYTFEMHRKQREDLESHRLSKLAPELKHKDAVPGESNERPLQQDTTNTDANLGELRTADTISTATETSVGVEQDQVQADEDREKREVAYNELDATEETKVGKQAWKQDHPDKTIKEFKEAYIQGKIDQLPWDGYVQNGEQNDDSIWQRIRNRNE